VLPTWVWAFQFPVALDPAVEGPALATLETVVLLAALAGTCLLVGYAAWSWRLAAAARGPTGLEGRRDGDPATGTT
jgi:hypothetical protein